MKQIALNVLMFLPFYVFATEFDYGGITKSKAKKSMAIKEQSLIVTKEGYYPKTISLFEGEKLRLFLSTTELDQSCFMLPSHNIFLAANPGSVNSALIHFPEPGNFEFYCPSVDIRGKVTVLQRKNNKIRKPASVRKKIWMPREY